MTSINNNIKVLATLHKISKTKNPSTSTPIPIPKAVLLNKISVDPSFIESSSFNEMVRNLQAPEKPGEETLKAPLAGDPTTHEDLKKARARDSVFEKWDNRPKMDTHSDWRKFSLFQF